jgi:hypothetical protein
MLLSNEKKSTTEISQFAIEIQNPNEILLISNEIQNPNEILLISNEMKNPNEKLTFSNRMKKQTKVAVMMFHLVLRLFLIKTFSFVFINLIENSMILQKL